MAVVVAVDESDGAWNAIRLAAKEAAWRQERLIAVTAYRADREVAVLAAASPGLPAAGEDDRTAAESALRVAVHEALGDDSDQVDLKAVAGQAGLAIVDTAREARAQLIVLAVRSGIATLPGTVSQYVLRHARCPVLLVPASRQAG